MKPEVVIVTPALRQANNGNWQTARRWAQMLADHYRVRIVDAWSEGDEALMFALHARRSAESVAAWRQRHGPRALAVVLTGTICTEISRPIRKPGARSNWPTGWWCCRSAGRASCRPNCDRNAS